MNRSTPLVSLDEIAPELNNSELFASLGISNERADFIIETVDKAINEFYRSDKYQYYQQMFPLMHTAGLEPQNVQEYAAIFYVFGRTIQKASCPLHASEFGLRSWAAISGGGVLAVPKDASEEEILDEIRRQGIFGHHRRRPAGAAPGPTSRPDQE